MPSWLIARERLPVDLLASFICGSAHFEAVANSGSTGSYAHDEPANRTRSLRVAERREANEGWQEAFHGGIGYEKPAIPAVGGYA